MTPKISKRKAIIQAFVGAVIPAAVGIIAAKTIVPSLIERYDPISLWVMGILGTIGILFIVVGSIVIYQYSKSEQFWNHVDQTIEDIANMQEARIQRLERVVADLRLPNNRFETEDSDLPF